MTTFKRSDAPKMAEVLEAFRRVFGEVSATYLKEGDFEMGVPWDEAEKPVAEE